MGADQRPPSPEVSYDRLCRRTDAPPGSAWGVFGADDELGTVNRLTPERTRAAAHGVRRGAVFNLDLALDAFDQPLVTSRRLPRHTIFQRNAHHRDDYLDSLYLQGVTQLDGLRHMAHPDHGPYNGHPAERFQPGDPLLGIQRWAEHGIAGRGVLIDVAGHLAAQGTPLAQETNQGVGVDVVDDAARAQGVALAEGDIVMLRFGFVHHYFHELDAAGRRVLHERGPASPGLAVEEDTVAWLWDHKVAVAAADNIAVEPWPPPEASPFEAEIEADPDQRSAHTGMMHRALIPLLGMALGELWDLEALAADCAADGVWDCLVTAKPLMLTGGVGSPANAMAIK